MKSRSHRLPVSEPHHDDWVDGSWTVDCICGVNFDDGEEMVDCDECGVWVHTRCSRYVKSEKCFACDKCKSKSSGTGGAGGVRNDSEETEVAEFLVELPTKTLRMDNPNPASVLSSRPFRLWTDIPMEERVHVQGVPGGDPGLFSGIKMSKVFGPELWKCSGYVPKKFDFRYTEFPFLGHGKVEEKKVEEMDKTSGEENTNQADNGAGVLFSLSKESENTFSTPSMDSVGIKAPIESGGCHDSVSPRQKKKLDAENLDFACCEVRIKKESSPVPIVLYSGKRKKEDGMSKDQNVKKKVRTVEKEGDEKNGAAHASKTEDRSSKTVSNDIRCGKDFPGDQVLDCLVECATNLASNEHGLESTLRNDVSSDQISKEGNGGDQVPVGSEDLFKTNNGMDSLTECNGPQSMHVEEEVPGDTLKTCGDVGGGTGDVEIGSLEEQPMALDVRLASPDAKESKHGQDSDIDEANSRPNKKLKDDEDNSRPNKKLKGELDADDHGYPQVESLPLNDVKLETMKGATQYPESSLNVFSEESKVIETSVISTKASDLKVLEASRSLTVGSSKPNKSDESPGNLYQSKREPAGSEGSMGGRKKSSLLKHSSEAADELVKSNGMARSHPIASYQRKAVFSVVKSTSTSAGIISKSSDPHGAATAQNISVHTRQKELGESSVENMKNNASADAIELEEKCGRPKKFVKEPSRTNSLSKISESTKLSDMSDSKRLSDSKDSGFHSSSKLQSVPNVASNHVSGECPSPSIDGAQSVHNKAAASAVPGKGEKFYQSGNHLSSRGNVASMIAPASSSVPLTLSDEELALLLHQELNSSPRVPRVPRMRHAGSLPQLTCPTATSTLMKRTSSVGGKDHSLASKRRTKDFSGEGLHGSLDADNEPKKTEGKPSPDSRRRDSSCSMDLLSRREVDGGPVKSVQSTKKNVNSSLSLSTEANGQNLSSSRPSSRNVSDDDPRMVGRQMNRTLPGLIAEIMSEGKRMTYEELCNAVLPHWPHLRKHNGERYAYSSHSQAVLDCLRNRSEWARLVDRGPKTSSSRKRRKLDADSVSIESEDNEENRLKSAKDIGSKSFESHQEDFPKGKRKARKRRRLSLQGRGIVRRRRRADVVSDDESESFSNSSEGGMSSEEEIQGGETSIVGSEASASSDEVR